MAIQTFRELKVWQRAHELALHMYKVTSNFPSEEKFGLISQMRRAAISVAANIVEGFRRAGARDSLRFYDIANASLEELRYETIVAHDLGYLSENEGLITEQKLEETSKMLNGWIRSQKRTPQKN